MTQVRASGKVNIDTGRDANLIGATVSGDKVVANAGCDLNIACTLQGGELTRAKISIDQPLDMRMEVVEVDENLPAIKMDVGLKIIQFQHEIVYRGAVWFQGETWSDFISNLEQGDGEANLKDMSDIFYLKLIRGIDTDSLIWKFRKEAVDASVGEAGFMCKSANINPFVEEFLSFYRWWE